MATKLSYDSEVEAADAPATYVPHVAEHAGRAAPPTAELTRLPLGETFPEPARKPYPGYVRLAILVGGAAACWAVVAGVTLLIL